MKQEELVCCGTCTDSRCFHTGDYTHNTCGFFTTEQVVLAPVKKSAKAELNRVIDILDDVLLFAVNTGSDADRVDARVRISAAGGIVAYVERGKEMVRGLR